MTLGANNYQDALDWHYAAVWGMSGKLCRWNRGPVQQLPEDFGVRVFPATDRTFCWVYATSGMGQKDPAGLELYLVAPAPDDAHIELLTVVAHYHLTGAKLGLHHTVNFGRPWLPGSPLDYGYISLPYPFGPALERFTYGETVRRCLWLVPVAKDEVEYKKRAGWDALEKRFEEASFNYLDPKRPLVVRV